MFIGRKSPLAYPGVLPDLNFAHPLAKNCRYVGIASGNNFVSLVNPNNIPAIHNAPTVVYTGQGPGVEFNATNSNLEMTGIIETPTSAIVSAILTPTATGQSFGVVFMTGNFANADIGLVLESNNFEFWTGGNSAQAFTFTFVANTPYYVIIQATNSSSASNTAYTAVIVNLATGQLYQGRTNGILTLGTITQAHYWIGGWSSGFQSKSIINAVSFSVNNPLNQAELVLLARDPWSLWYPPTIQAQIFAGLQGQTGPSPQSLTDSAASSDSFTVVGAFTASLAETTSSSSDTYTPALVLTASLAETAASSDAYLFIQQLTDSAASSDLFSIPVSLTADNVTTSDTFIVVTTPTRAQADSAVSWDVYTAIVNTGGIVFECGPIPIFPSVPESFPVKLSLVMDTVVGTTKSLREMRVPQQTYPLWDIELVFEELTDQTQNEVPYGPFTGSTNYEQICQQWLMMYGQTGIFAFDAPWDDSRTLQEIGVGDGTTTQFTVFRTWGSGALATVAPVGMINTITAVYVNGGLQSPTTYTYSRSSITFSVPPAEGYVIQMTFSFYYVCRWTEDEQDFEEFSKNRWAVPSLKFRAVYWPGCQ